MLNHSPSSWDIAKQTVTMYHPPLIITPPSKTPLPQIISLLIPISNSSDLTSPLAPPNSSDPHPSSHANITITHYHSHQTLSALTIVDRTSMPVKGFLRYIEISLRQRGVPDSDLKFKERFQMLNVV